METVAEEDAEPPDPEHSIVNVLSPTLSKDNDSVPEVDFVPLQSPLAVQVDVLVDDQVTETTSYTYAESGSMEIEAVGAGVGVGIGVEAASPPPPPPPPQDDITNNNSESIICLLYE